LINGDLHTHTNASDGTYTPTQLIETAAQFGLKSIAITDHDSVSGVEEGIKVGKKLGIEVIPGIELSLDYPGIPGSIHLLGLCIEYQSPIITKYLDNLQEYRKNRNLEMLDKLQKLNFAIALDDFPNVPLDVLGRAHIARKMLEKGFVSTLNEAFENYLKKGEKAYVNKKRYSIEEGIDMIHQLKGVACLAHPYTLKLNHTQLEIFIKYLKEVCSLDGIEVFYPEHSPRFVDFYLFLANKYKLIPTGGSDFHGENRPDVHIGKNFYPIIENPKITYQEILDAVKQRALSYS